jgi:predicted regulator of Ras-like GTPase activity (Roadblock/LC7/MglB family)
MPHAMTDPRKEAPRDQVESAFTGVLRRLRDSAPSVLSAAFVDTEGECIDYASALDPYEAKVNAAHMLMLMHALRATREKVRAGEPIVLEIAAETRDAWVQTVGDDYVLVLLLEPGFDRVELKQAVAMACNEFRTEVGIAAPPWESVGQHLSVRVRPSTAAWEYAPAGFTSGERKRVVISDVLGRWTEPREDGNDELVCFRVRTADGRELTLVHDPDVDGWLERE